MSETYYIRLPFYLLNGTATRTVDISFDDTVVSSAEITAVDNSAMNNVTFSVDKIPGIYKLKITPKYGEDGFTSVCLDDVWVSNNNVDFYSVLINYPATGRPIVNNLPSAEFGFNPAKGACLYTDVEFEIEIDLPDSSNWEKLYYRKTLAGMEERIAILQADPDSDAKLLTDVETAYSLFKDRGYS